MLKNFLNTSFLYLLLATLGACATSSESGNKKVGSQYSYDVGMQFPFGKAHPDAPDALMDFDPMIGESTCQSDSRNPDGSWGEPQTMRWRFKYIMNGTAVQDETLKPDGGHSGSIRQFFPEENAWFVHYYSNRMPTKSLSTWEGGKRENGDIVLYKDETAPNGMEGQYRLTFYDISPKNFKWLGEWVNPDESIIYPTWKISCQKN